MIFYFISPIQPNLRTPPTDYHLSGQARYPSLLPRSMSAMRTVIARTASRTRSTIPPPPNSGLSHCIAATLPVLLLPLRAQRPIGIGLINLHTRRYLATGSSNSSRAAPPPTNHNTNSQVSPHVYTHHPIPQSPCLIHSLIHSFIYLSIYFSFPSFFSSFLLFIIVNRLLSFSGTGWPNFILYMRELHRLGFTKYTAVP